MTTETLPRRQIFWNRAAVAFALVLPTLVTLAYFVLAASASAAVQQFVYLVTKVFQFSFPLLWVVAVQKVRPRLLPLSGKGVLSGLAFGLAIALAIAATYSAWLQYTPFFADAEASIRAKIEGMNLTQPGVFIAVGVFYSLVHSLLEEYYWRWFVYGQLRQLTRISVAILISSLGFMAHHVLVLGTYFGFSSAATWLFSLSIAIGGAVWAWLYERSGSLVGPWLSHMLVDAAIFAVGFHISQQIPAT